MTHEGCSGSFSTGKEVLEKVRMMGFSEQFMPVPFYIECSKCNKEFEMLTFESKCPNCLEIYAVTPCHAFDPSNIVSAGKK